MRDSNILLRDQYGTEEMHKVWEGRNMVQKWLDVEAAIADAQGRLGIIPAEVSAEIIQKCSVDYLTPEMISSVKVGMVGRWRHLIVAMIKAFKEISGPAGEYLHLGATTQDILDTGLTLQIKEAYHIIMRDLLGLERILIEVAEKYKNTVMMGRTSGQHAVPVTFGFKVAIWASEIRDHIERLKETSERLFLGNVSGATGTRASFVLLAGTEKTIEFHKLVCKRLGLKEPLIDLHQRTDRFAEIVNNLALISCTLAEIGLEIRNLQRTDIAEVSEPWETGKSIGSSTMANKRNPFPSEWNIGLAKIARANAIAMMDIQMSHERDETRTPVEFACIPENFLMTDFAIQSAIDVFSGIVVNENRMRQNLGLTKGLSMAEAVMLKLAQKTGKKVTAHEIVYKDSMKAFEEDRPLKEVLLEDPEVKKYLSAKEIQELVNPETYIGTAPQQVDAVISYIKGKRKTDKLVSLC